MLGRAIDYATFYVSAALCLWRLAKAGDVVVMKTDPPMLSLIGAPVCWLRRVRFVNWLQDIFPEAAEALVVGGRAVRAGYSVLRPLRNRSLKTAHTNVVLGERMAGKLSDIGIPKNRVNVISNWADGSVITQAEHAKNGLRSDWGLTGEFVVGYSGNLGRAHDIDTLLEAMSILEQTQLTDPRGRQEQLRRVSWLFVGGGALTQRLKTEVSRRRLTSVRFRPYQSNLLLAQSLSAADVHIVSLRPELEGLIVPSKFYGICAAGRPSIFIGDPDGEIARLIARIGCGRTVPMGDGVGLARTILEIAADSETWRRMGTRAREAFEEEFDKTLAILRWERLLLEVTGEARTDAHTGSVGRTRPKVA
jgi:glycosyltransferase involved in cell wall biosynthesis